MKTSEEGSVPFFWMFECLYITTEQPAPLKWNFYQQSWFWYCEVFSSARVRLLNILFAAAAARPPGAAAALSHVGSASLFGFSFSAALQSLKSVKTDAQLFPCFQNEQPFWNFCFDWRCRSKQKKECCLSCLIAGWTLWSGPHGQSWRGAGRAWYQSSVVLLFHARLESTSLWTRLREWRHCRAETGKEIPQTFGTKLKAKYRYDELCFDWTSCAKMTGWYLQFNHSGGFLPASLICTSAVFLFFVFFCVGIMEEFPHILGKSWNEEVVQKWGLIVGTFCLVMLLQIWCSKSKTLMNCWKTQRRDRWVLPGYLVSPNCRFVWVWE